MQQMLKSGEEVDPYKQSQEEIEIQKYNNEDSQFWNYKHETYPNEEGELARLKNKPGGQPELYEWKWQTWLFYSLKLLLGLSGDIKL